MIWFTKWEKTNSLFLLYQLSHPQLALLVATLTWQENEYKKLAKEKKRTDAEQELKFERNAAEFLELREKRERLAVENLRPIDELDSLEGIDCVLPLA